MSASITLKVRLGPLVSFEVRGESCGELAEALQGYEKLNVLIDALCSDLAERVYPGGLEEEVHEGQEEEE